MNTLTYEDALPFLEDTFWAKNSKPKTVNPINRKNNYETTEDACINLRKHFPTFHIRPEHYIERLESAQILDDKAEGLKRFLGTKIPGLRFDGFDRARFLESGTINEMADYIGAKLRNSITSRKELKIGDFRMLIENIENNFLSHISWHLEKHMNELGAKIQQQYTEFINTTEKRRFTDEERIYLRDTIASLNEYKRNLQKQYLISLRQRIYGKDIYTGDMEELALRMIAVPGSRNARQSDGVINKVKGWFSKILN